METPTLDWYRRSPSSTGFDEVVDERGRIRPGWATLGRRFSELGASGLIDRRRRCEDLLAAHGATHAPHRELLVGGAGPTGWRLDPIPFVFEPDEWQRISAAIAERARVIAEISRDLGGARSLISERVVPASAVFGDPVFLPSTPPGGEGPLLWYGADLVRGADGRWRVLRDVTDVVRGIGEALLHRSILGRAFGDVFERTTPTALGGHLGDIRDALAAAAPRGSVSPRTVVLAPQDVSSAFIATSYLCAQLGFHRTSAADLVVRDSRVHLRSLGGLEPVDVIVRSVPAIEVDPLANPQRGGGVPGLLTAERAGRVTLANPIAAALAGSSSMAPHVDAAARHLLGRAPTMETVGTMWCGDRSVLAEVLRDPGRWVLEDTRTGESAFGTVLEESSDAGPGPRREWRARLELRPRSIVARPFLEFASAPVLRSDRIESAAVVVGVSAIVNGNSVSVLPGGFARVVERGEPVLAQHHGLAKDVWVFGGESARQAVRVQPLPQVDLRSSLPTRAAEAMYWLGRGAEAAEVRARLIRTIGDRLASGDGVSPTWSSAAARMLHTTRSADGSPIGTLEEELSAAIDGRRGLLDQLDGLVMAASTVREFLSTSTGRVVADVVALRRALRSDDPDSLERLLVSLAALAGLAQESTVRGPAWRLADLGRRIERTMAVLGAVEAALGSPIAAGEVQSIGETLLAAHESLVAYRRWHRTDIEVDDALDLLLRDDSNPRGVAFQLDRIVEHLAVLPASIEDRRLAADAASALFAGDVTTVVLGVRGPLLGLIDRLALHWFADPVVPRRLADGERS